MRSLMRCSFLLLVLAVALSVPPCSRVRAAEIAGVSFPNEFTAQGVAMDLRGLGLLRWKLIFKAYVAAFWVARDAAADTDVLDDIPKRLEIEYFYSFEAEDFAWATVEGIKANVDSNTLERLQPQIEQLNRLYRDVERGDRYALTYVTGVGTELALNGKPLGTVEGSEFASAVFAIWLGDVPLSRSLKAKLLGRQ